MLLTIDIGNTRIKAAVFEKDKLVDGFVFTTKDAKQAFEKIFSNYPKIQNSIASSVNNLDKEVLSTIQKHSDFVEVTSALNLPFVNHYATPNTLGVDRIVVMAGASLLFPNKDVVVIDCGTCITYDFLNFKKEYFGGAISLGLRMRYTALNTFTAKLPLLQNKQPKSYIGDTTDESIHCGVVNGLLYEMEGFISQFSLKSEDLTLILTGGDAEFLAKSLKSTIFVRSNFLLESLNALFKYLTRDNE